MSKAVDRMAELHLRIAQIWRGEVMSEKVFRPARPPKSGSNHVVARVRLGAGAKDDFTLPETVVPPKTVFARLTPHACTLSLRRGMSGKLSLQGREREVAELLGVAPEADVSLVVGDAAIIALDAEQTHVLFVQVKPPERQPPGSPFIDWHAFGPSLALSSFVHVAALLLVFFTLWLFPHASGDESLTVYLVRPPTLPPVADKNDDASKPKAGTADGDKKEKPAATAGDAGKGGGQGDKPREKRPDAGAADPQRDRMVAKVQETGVLKHRGTLASLTHNPLGLSRSGAVGPLTAGGAGFGKGSGSGAGDDFDGTGTILKGSAAGSGGGGTSHADIVTTKEIKTGGNRAARGIAGGAVKEASVNLGGVPDGDFGGLTADQIQKVVMKNRAAIEFCYTKELQRFPSLAGKIVVNWRIDAGGTVTAARIKSTTMNNAAVEDCINRKVKQWRFPAAGGGVVNYPFIFAGR